ncbi:MULTISPECIES: flavodoxin family protein [unclassified Methanoculleus]|uniref:flavodoxin family protein n=1 Tax=unclassified Methanoculleus TaxID=2619537 RepID=UPI0025F40815|nr:MULTISPECIES: flavodoxin family protein [unclassified Methanoculleus]MDD2252752.1 flavodoxin family protein [Methanoculleus sp.]
MKIVAFNGSPRAEQSNTHVMVEAFLAGAQGAGAEVENIFLAEKRLGYCLGCFSCWSKTPGTCIQADGMEELLEKYLSADVAVFATPLHNDNVSVLTKNFIDRLLPAGDPHFERDEVGEVRHVRGARPAPKFVMIANCGFPEQSHFQVLRLLTRRMARNYHTEFVGEIYRGMGSLLQEEELRPLIDAYRGLLGMAGAEVVINGRISPETGQRLEEPLIPAPDYVDIFLSNVNAYMEEGIAANRRA